MANIKDVARRAGVSISTVSRVLNATKPVSPDLQKKVMDAVHELDYSANIFAKGLKGASSGIIAVVLTAISRTFFTTVLEGIHEVAETNGYSMLITETYDDCKREMRLLSEMASRGVDGIILASSAQAQDEETLEYIRNLHLLNKNGHVIPVVSLEFPLDNPHIDAVVIDSEQAAYDATTKLIEECHRKKLVHISLPEEHYLGRKRIQGFLRALREHGLPVNENSIVEGNYSPESGFHAMEEVLSGGREVDGVFCSNDDMAIGALKACANHKIMVPEQIAVMGNDDIFSASIISPSLSSIHVPKTEMGRAAAAKLMERIQQGEYPEKRDVVSLQYTLIDRQSTVGSRALADKNWNWK